MPLSLRPRSRLGLATLGGGGGGKSEWNFASLIGRVVMFAGKGRDSIRVNFSRGMEVRSEAGRSTGEQATIACRRWVLVAKNARFSASLC